MVCRIFPASIKNIIMNKNKNKPKKTPIMLAVVKAWLTEVLSSEAAELELRFGKV